MFGFLNGECAPAKMRQYTNFLLLPFIFGLLNTTLEQKEIFISVCVLI